MKKSLEEKQAVTLDKKRKLKKALDENKAIPTEIRGDERDLRKTLDMADARTDTLEIDNEYAYVGSRDPKVLITTSRDPSSRLTQFLKELRLIFPESQRVNRGGYVMKDLIEMCRKHEMTDLVVVHEHRGEPDGLIVCHLPYGPTAYFSLHDVVLRHDLATRAPTVSEARPHLIFHEFDSKFGRRVKSILQALFPCAAPLSKRVMTFANVNDSIHFRHHVWDDETKKIEGEEAEEAQADRKKETKLTECGPRFTMRLFKIELGTLEMKDVKAEWVLRPYFNKQKSVLASQA